MCIHGLKKKYFEMISRRKCSYEKCQNPERNDYIVKIPVKKDIDKIEDIIQEIKKDVDMLEQFMCSNE